ncbi:kinetochore Sim4 complex subunit FTA2-domain-containing protein [Xylaria scruposa]|nr:kinetochore Sim4 complex subunit FTA2-domain-containing protein [Xylaria scruposa]
MYPDWPKSTADLVPLPYCNGPKLKPFPFQGPQRIKFLGYLGEGSHAHVFKTETISGSVVKISGKAETTFYNYTEAFNSECRTFGSLQEAGYEELAIECFSYLLLYDESIRDMCSIFPGKNGRAPPIRGIVKEFGSTLKDMREKDLSIIGLDIADRQLINGKLSDLSIAITTPHSVTTPDLNPDLTWELTRAMESELFRIAKEDYHDIDAMLCSFSDANYSPSNRNKILRDLPPRQRVCRKATESGHGKPRAGISKTRIQLKAKPSWWYCGCNNEMSAQLKNPGYGYSLMWELKALPKNENGS